MKRYGAIAVGGSKPANPNGACQQDETRPDNGSSDPKDDGNIAPNDPRMVTEQNLNGILEAV